MIQHVIHKYMYNIVSCVYGLIVPGLSPKICHISLSPNRKIKSTNSDIVFQLETRRKTKSSFVFLGDMGRNALTLSLTRRKVKSSLCTWCSSRFCMVFGFKEVCGAFIVFIWTLSCMIYKGLRCNHGNNVVCLGRNLINQSGCSCSGYSLCLCALTMPTLLPFYIYLHKISE